MIDWATITRITIKIGYGLDLNLVRWGKLVIGNIWGQFTSLPPKGDWKNLGETIPDGYVPRYSVRTWLHQNSTNVGHVVYSFNSDGTMQLQLQGTWNNTTERVYGQVMWFAK